MNIIGAGLAGLIAGVLNENAIIYEPMSKNNSHKALLRFRSPQIGEAVGIPFKKVTAYKGIWYRGNNVSLSPEMISKYSNKVSDTISHRSICNLAPETRYIAPEDFQDELRHMCNDRIMYSANPADYLDDHTIISTVPMNILAKYIYAEDMLEEGMDIIKSIRPIYVTRFKIARCDAYMTYYYPDPRRSAYRASISGDMLIIESVTGMTDEDLREVMDSFGIWTRPMEREVLNYEQRNGKMTPIDDRIRKKFILHATMKHGIYSLGRFAIWKNILLDDVYQDVLRIKQFINRDKYDHMKEL